MTQSPKRKKATKAKVDDSDVDLGGKCGGAKQEVFLSLRSFNILNTSEKAFQIITKEKKHEKVSKKRH